MWEALTGCASPALRFVEHRLREWARPHGVAPLALGMVADLARSKGELFLENALLRQQLIVAREPTVETPSAKSLPLFVKGPVAKSP